MKYRLLLALFATAALSYSTAHAQDDDDDDDQEFDYFAYFAKAHSNLTFGFRATQGAKVKFGNLGSIPVPVSTDPTILHNYSNGSIGLDGSRPSEFDASGNPVASSGGRYQTTGSPPDGNGNPILDSNGQLITRVTGDYVSYVPGFTRVYTINDPSQVVNGNVVMSQYSAVSEGAGFEGNRAISGGVELQAERLLTDPTKRFKFSLVAGVSLNGINSKKTGTVSSTLHIQTDSYSLNGNTLPATTFPYVAPDVSGSGTYTASDGSTSTASKELTIPIPGNPTSTTEADDEDGAQVNGVWEIKGSYLVIRFGPELTAAPTPNLSFNASAGFAGAYVGTNYTATETAEVTDPGVISGNITTGAVTSEVSKFLPGYYANLDASWAVNERTGFYAGFAYESFGDFTQTLGDRTARIDLGGNASVRGGLNIKF